MKTLILSINLFAVAAAFFVFYAPSASAQACVWTMSGDFVCGGSQGGYDFPETVLTDLPPVYDPDIEDVEPIDVGDTELNVDGAMFEIMNVMGNLPVCQQIDAAAILDAFMLDLEEQYPDDFESQQAAIEAYPPPYLEIINFEKYFLGELIETPADWVYSPVLNECVPPVTEALVAINAEIDNLPVCQQAEARAILESLLPAINSLEIDTGEPPYITQVGDVTYLLGEPLTTPYYYVPRFGDNTPTPEGFGTTIHDDTPYTGNCGPPGENTRDAITAAIAAELTTCQQTEANTLFADLELDVLKGDLVPTEPYIVDLGAGNFSFLGTPLATNAAAVPPDCL